jgi:hypothetical protein
VKLLRTLFLGGCIGFTMVALITLLETLSMWQFIGIMSMFVITGLLYLKKE